jgi:tetratricopeptide (TPR) repeat protein
MPNDSTPFVGPRPFKREDAALFFGRTDEADELLSLVVAEREVLLYAQSGAGKTSLLNAGLTPLLEKEGFEVLPVARVRYEAREEIETRQIANVYVFNVVAGWSALMHHVSNLDSMTLADFLDQLPPQLDKEGLPRPRLLIFDQFEELFTFYPERASDRQGFFEQVRDALGKNRLLRVIFAMREEYIAEVTPYAAILPEKLRTRFRLERLREPAALQAVTGPLTRSRFSFVPGVAEKVVQDLLLVNVGNKTHAIRGEYVEPVQLQVVCDALCRHLPPNVSVITLDHLQDFGNVNEALANFYKECLKETTRTTHVRRGRLRKWFERTLITPEGVRDTVRQGPTKTGGLPNRAVRKLEELHLIRGEERPGRGRWYELTHDTFIRPIQEVNGTADRRMHLFQTIAATAALVVLVTACVVLYQSNMHHKQVAAFMARGAQLTTDGKYEDALEQFEQALAVDPRYRPAHVEAADSHSMLYILYKDADHRDQAVSHYQKALKIKPDFSVHLKLGRFYSSVGVPSNAGDVAEDILDKAQAEMDEASKLDPASPEPDVVRGEIEFWRERGRKRQKYSDAEKHYREAIKKDPKWGDAYIGLAKVHLNRGEAVEAMHDARRAVELGSGLPDPHRVLGEVYWIKGDYTQAAAELNRAIGLQSTDYLSHHDLAGVYYLEGNYELAKMEDDQALRLANSIKYRPWMAQADSSLGYIALKQGAREVAASHFEEALKSDPDNYSARFALGLLSAAVNEPEKATAYWNRGLELCKGADQGARMKRVIFEVALGMPESVEDMSSIITEHPPIGMMHDVLDDVDSLVAFKIQPAESGKVRDMLVDAIKEARNQPAQKE